MKLLGIIIPDQLLHSGEKREYNETVHQLLIDFKKAYDSVRRKYCTVFS
jgi:hypothetical protein